MNTPAPRLPGRPGQVAVTLWALLLAACLLIVTRTTFTTDLSAFLPRNPNNEQRILVDQLKNGVLSRTLLVSVSGGSPEQRAQASIALARSLRPDTEFESVVNGALDPEQRDRDGALLFRYRYLLSPDVTPDRFTVEGLRSALDDTLDLLASPAGLSLKPLVDHDPTGETMHVADELDPGGHPPVQYGAWSSKDGQHAMLLITTSASGSDTDAQERAIDTIRARFDALHTPLAIEITGSPKFAVDSRATIKSEVTRLSIVSAVLIITILLFAYRSAAVLGLSLLPVLSGALAGIAAVSLTFGSVHGITLGFGTTLIGEAVDYSIYLFIQSSDRSRRPMLPAPGDRNALRAARDARLRRWVARAWPTVRLGMLTSICGFSALTFSSFPGLAQLGVYSIAGLVVAAAVTRWVLPVLTPLTLSVRDLSGIGARLSRFAEGARRYRLVAAGLIVVWVVVAVIVHPHAWINDELNALSPVPPAAIARDQALRAQIGAPDARYMVVIGAPTFDATLQGAELAAPVLDRLVATHAIGGYESPARYLPSEATQRRRQESLPAAADLRARLAQAVQGTPFDAKALEPFIADVDSARSQPVLTAGWLRGTSLALGINAMIDCSPGRCHAMLPLRAPKAGADIDANAVRAALASVNDGPGRVTFVDLKSASDAMYDRYMREALRLALAGLIVIVALLALTLRSLSGLARVLGPLAGAVVAVVAGLGIAGVSLTLLHVIGLLLIVAVGSNYALFFARNTDHDLPEAVTFASLAVANLTTVAGFGVLALSSVPLLKAFGETVGPGAILALWLAALLSPRSRRPADIVQDSLEPAQKAPLS
ncbi:Membrane transport protein MMPL domain-containing protein [Pararobbsia alpina]|uniref:MMPL family transporter n=1 Tax=Pararobbsia alpina TaxID=621374 RepID=UPI0039A4F8A4